MSKSHHIIQMCDVSESQQQSKSHDTFAVAQITLHIWRGANHIICGFAVLQITRRIAVAHVPSHTITSHTLLWCKSHITLCCGTNHITFGFAVPQFISHIAVVHITLPVAFLWRASHDTLRVCHSKYAMCHAICTTGKPRVM